MFHSRYTKWLTSLVNKRKIVQLEKLKKLRVVLARKTSCFAHLAMWGEIAQNVVVHHAIIANIGAESFEACRTKTVAVCL